MVHCDATGQCGALRIGLGSILTPTAHWPHLTISFYFLHSSRAFASLLWHMPSSRVAFVCSPVFFLPFVSAVLHLVLSTSRVSGWNRLCHRANLLVPLLLQLFNLIKLRLTVCVFGACIYFYNLPIKLWQPGCIMFNYTLPIKSKLYWFTFWSHGFGRRQQIYIAKLTFYLCIARRPSSHHNRSTNPFLVSLGVIFVFVCAPNHEYAIFSIHVRLCSFYFYTCSHSVSRSSRR